MRATMEHMGRPAGASAAILGLVTAAGLALSGCAVGSGSATSQLTTAASSAQSNASRRPAVSAKVALLLPLSAKGQHAVIAKGMKQAAELALFENNNPGFNLIVKDTKGTSEGAAAAATSAAASGAELILGPLFANSVTSVSRVARQARIPVVAFSNDQRVAGSGTYLLSFQVSEEVERVVGFAASRGRRQFAALIPDTAYGNIVERAFRASVERNGGIVIVMARYPSGPGGALAPARKLVDDINTAEETGAAIDALFLPGGIELLTSVGPTLAHAQLDLTRIRLLGTGGWDHPSIGRERNLIGSWYPAPDPRNWRAFSEKFSNTFGSAPPRIASLAHNAVTIAIRLATSHPRGQRYTPANLRRPNGFIGVDGAVRFTQQGLAERGLAVLEVQKYGSQVVSPAAETFNVTAQKPSSSGFFRFN
ncbi:MAG: penicillin-binding protein activator [Hyphomicrobiaceae bacterium]